MRCARYLPGPSSEPTREAIQLVTYYYASYPACVLDALASCSMVLTLLLPSTRSRAMHERKGEAIVPPLYTGLRGGGFSGTCRLVLLHIQRPGSSLGDISKQPVGKGASSFALSPQITTIISFWYAFKSTTPAA